MHINKTNNYISFQRAIKVYSQSNRIDDGKRVNGSTRAVFYTLYDKSDIPSTLKTESIYDSETSRKIREFLLAQIKDYSPQTGFLLRKINGEIYLFTGKDVKEVQIADDKLSHKNSRSKNQIGKDLYENPTSNSIKAQKRAERKFEKIKAKNYQNRDEKLLKMVEADTKITINMDSTHKAESIEYFSKKDDNITKNTLVI